MKLGTPTIRIPQEVRWRCYLLRLFTAASVIHTEEKQLKINKK